MQIGAEARAEKKNFQLAQIYDEICRRKWAERAFRGIYVYSSVLRLVPCARRALQITGDLGFSVNESAEYKDPDILNRARLKFEEEYKKSAQKQTDGQCAAHFVFRHLFVSFTFKTLKPP